MKRIKNKLFENPIFLQITIITAIVCHSYAQENAQTRIPNSLAECYEDPFILNRDNRLPLTTNTLIELIRKVEDTPGFNYDIQQMAIGLVQRFRLDGIERAPGIFQSNVVLPYSPSGFQFSKHRLLLSRLIPGHAHNFPNDTLTAIERCTLHSLLSSSIESQVRGDEATRCGQLAQFRAMRVPTGGYESPMDSQRKRRSIARKNNYIGDVEMMDDLQVYRLQKRLQKEKGRYMSTGDGDEDEPENRDEKNDEDDREMRPIDGTEDNLNKLHPRTFDEDAGLIDVASNAISQCPVENGVMRTTWGAVAVGPLIAGIAAGLTQQTVTTRELLTLTKSYSRNRFNGQQQQQQLSVDNRWAATLAGDLAEVALLQGPMTNRISVGAAGAWNSTALPRWYFLSQRERLELTDAEIRGGIDGLVLAQNIRDWRSQVSQLRLSQVLDMYYSQRGVLSTDIRSCSRREQFTRIAPIAELQRQTIAFSTVLDREMQLRVTLTTDAIQEFSNNAAQALVAYVANNLNDVTCDATASFQNNSIILRTATDLHIYVDTTWQFREIQPVISTLVENIDVNRFGSRVTLYNANDASLIVNTTSTLSELYTQWNETIHQLQTSGLNMANIVRSLRTSGQAILTEENRQNSVGGRSHIALIVAQMAGVNEADANFAWDQITILREIIPDLTLLFVAGGSPGRFSRFVRDPQRDLFPLPTFSSSGTDNGQQVFQNIQPVIQRIQQVPRRIINPRCNADWSQNNWGGNNVDEYVEPNGINFYRIHPNYFFQPGGNRRVRIQGHGHSQISVCSSRWVERPRHNNQSQTQENVECRQLLPNDFVDYDLSNACEGYFLIQTCPPLFVSVEGISSRGVNNFPCADNRCRFPDNIRYGLNVDNLGCFSSVQRNLSSLVIILIAIFLVLRF